MPTYFSEFRWISDHSDHRSTLTFPSDRCRQHYTIHKPVSFYKSSFCSSSSLYTDIERDIFLQLSRSQLSSMRSNTFKFNYVCEGWIQVYQSNFILLENISFFCFKLFCFRVENFVLHPLFLLLPSPLREITGRLEPQLPLEQEFPVEGALLCLLEHSQTRIWNSFLIIPNISNLKKIFLKGREWQCPDVKKAGVYFKFELVPSLPLHSNCIISTYVKVVHRCHVCSWNFVSSKLLLCWDNCSEDNYETCHINWTSCLRYD